jgi:hypothetical protein
MRRANLLTFVDDDLGTEVVVQARKGATPADVAHLQTLPGADLRSQVTEYAGISLGQDVPAMPDEVYQVLEGNCPVHPSVRLELRLDGAGYCYRCSEELDGLDVGYRVLPTSTEPSP